MREDLDGRVVVRLGQAIERGVDVRILTNGPHIDQQVVRQAGRPCYQRLLDCGVRVFEYQRAMVATLEKRFFEDLGTRTGWTPRPGGRARCPPGRKLASAVLRREL